MNHDGAQTFHLEATVYTKQKDCFIEVWVGTLKFVVLVSHTHGSSQSRYALSGSSTENQWVCFDATSPSYLVRSMCPLTLDLLIWKSSLTAGQVNILYIYASNFSIDPSGPLLFLLSYSSHNLFVHRFQNICYSYILTLCITDHSL